MGGQVLSYLSWVDWVVSCPVSTLALYETPGKGHGKADLWDGHIGQDGCLVILPAIKMFCTSFPPPDPHSTYTVYESNTTSKNIYSTGRFQELQVF